MATKRAAPNSDTSSSKRFKADSESLRSATPHEIIIPPNCTFDVTYDTALSKKGLSKASLAKHTAKERKVLSPWPELSGQDDLFGDYTVSPSDLWNAMSVYSNCIISNNTYRKSEYVYVRGPTTPSDTSDVKQFWVGRILQIRASDPQNVYALVAWLYWPEELPELKGKRKSGRQSYHGMGEMIASNYLEVVEVLSFAGHADMSFWDESGDIIATQLYWRQTFSRDTKELSKIKQHCTCKGAFNPDPDKSMLVCDNSSCGLWQHPQCLINQAISQVARDPSRPLDSNTSTGSKKKAKLSGKLVEDGAKVEVEITDTSSGPAKATKTRRTACCLGCKAELLP